MALAVLGFPRVSAQKKKTVEPAPLEDMASVLLSSSSGRHQSATVVSGRGNVHRCGVGCGSSGEVAYKLYPF